jgi:putative FmdB family regulatory protein
MLYYVYCFFCIPSWIIRKVEVGMPVYEYRCDECGELFEQTETLAEHEAGSPTCPKCKSERVSRRFSTFQVKTSRKS